MMEKINVAISVWFFRQEEKIEPDDGRLDIYESGHASKVYDEIWFALLSNSQTWSELNLRKH